MVGSFGLHCVPRVQSLLLMVMACRRASQFWRFCAFVSAWVPLEGVVRLSAQAKQMHCGKECVAMPAANLQTLQVLFRER